MSHHDEFFSDDESSKGGGRKGGFLNSICNEILTPKGGNLKLKQHRKPKIKKKSNPINLPGASFIRNSSGNGSGGGVSTSQTNSKSNRDGSRQDEEFEFKGDELGRYEKKKRKLHSSSTRKSDPLDRAMERQGATTSSYFQAGTNNGKRTSRPRQTNQQIRRRVPSIASTKTKRRKMAESGRRANTASRQETSKQRGNQKLFSHVSTNKPQKHVTNTIDLCNDEHEHDDIVNQLEDMKSPCKETNVFTQFFVKETSSTPQDKRKSTMVNGEDREIEHTSPTRKNRTPQHLLEQTNDRSRRRTQESSGSHDETTSAHDVYTLSETLSYELDDRKSTSSPLRQDQESVIDLDGDQHRLPRKKNSKQGDKRPSSTRNRRGSGVQSVLETINKGATNFKRVAQSTFKFTKKNSAKRSMPNVHSNGDDIESVSSREMKSAETGNRGKAHRLGSSMNSVSAKQRKLIDSKSIITEHDYEENYLPESTQFHNTPIPKKQKAEDDDSFQEKEKGKVSNENKEKKRSYGRRPGKPIYQSPLRRSTRKKKTKNAANEIVTISSDENEDNLIDTDEDLVDDNDIEGKQIKQAIHNSLNEPSSPSRSNSFGATPYQMNAARIAVGSKIFVNDCRFYLQLSTQLPFLKLVFKTKQNTALSPSECKMIETSHKINIDDGSIEECRFFFCKEDSAADVDELITFLALRIAPDKENDLVRYSNAYANNYHEKAKGIESKKYILIEARNNDDLQLMLTGMRRNDTLNSFLKGSELPIEVAKEYSTALRLDVEKSRRSRHSSIRANKGEKKRVLDKSSSKKLMMVYPFNATPEVLQDSRSVFVESQKSLSKKSEDESSSGEKDTVLKEEDISIAPGQMGRTHLLTIRGEDVERLEPGEFLNDTLIDFWMKWISRKEDPLQSQYHFFTTQFFSKLQEEGAASVSSWTTKKSINIFEKKYIFIPINEHLHWSLCVVVNAGKIMNAHQPFENGEKKEAAIILFLDSLKAHKKHKVCSIVRKWLTYEAKKLSIFQDLPDRKLFDKNFMPLLDPPIPYQDNSWDCGVFVCRYALSILRLDDEAFTIKSFSERDTIKDLKHYFAESSAFNFGMDEIRRLRSQMEALIDSLSQIYRRVVHMDRILEKKRKKKLTADHNKLSAEGDPNPKSEEDNCSKSLSEGDKDVLTSNGTRDIEKAQDIGEENEPQISPPPENLCQREATNSKIENHSDTFGLQTEHDPCGRNPPHSETENHIGADKSKAQHTDFATSGASLSNDEVQRDEENSNSQSRVEYKQSTESAATNDLVRKEQNARGVVEEQKDPFGGESGSNDESKTEAFSV